MQPIRRGYEQVAAQLRTQIERGALPPGARLPPEDELARQFGTSRQTIREALRLLGAWNLIRSAAGRGGGTFVKSLDVFDVADVVQANLALLTSNQTVTLEDLLEGQELLEIPGAELAATRCDMPSLQRLRAAVLAEPLDVVWAEQHSANIDFHLGVMQAAMNPMLVIAHQPLLHVLRSHTIDMHRTDRFRQDVEVQHARILEAIEAGDPERAGREMRDHLAYLRPFYARVKIRTGRR